MSAKVVGCSCANRSSVGPRLVLIAVARKAASASKAAAAQSDSVSAGH